MKAIIFMFSAVLMSCAGPEGPVGLTGATGPQGVSDTVYVKDTSTVDIGIYKKEGILTITTNNYWELTISPYEQGDVFTVLTRQNSGYMWGEPTWYLQESTNIALIRINDDTKASAGCEYRIIWWHAII